MKLLGKIKHFVKIQLWYFNHREKKVSYGNDYPDKIFYVIGVDYDTQGLFAIIKNTLIHIEYALEKKYIPIVDMKNFSSQFINSGGINIWEIFFKQPSNFGLPDISSAKKVIYSRNVTYWPERSIFPNVLDEVNSARLEALNKVYTKNVKLSDEMEVLFSKKKEEILGDKKNIMGVLCRGTDYTQKEPKGHPIQPSFYQFQKMIDPFFEKEVIQYLYIATEDKNYLELFKSAYKDKVLFINQTRFGDIKVDYLSKTDIDINSRIRMNMDYLASIYILSQLDYFIGGRTAGTIGVKLIKSGPFKFFYSYNLGAY